MTSLGLLQYSEINESSSTNSNSNITETEKKRQTRHNSTVKKRQTAPSDSSASKNPQDNPENVQNMLKLINNTNGYEDDTGSGLADFNPPPRAEVSSKIEQQQMEQASVRAQASGRAQASVRAQAKQPNVDYEKPTTIINTNNTSENDQSYNSLLAAGPRQYPVPLDTQEGFGSLPKNYASDFYKQYVPYFNQTSNQPSINNRDQLLEKLNYMIHLLEEQKDEKTGHVIEEVILYSFLGVFIIFIVDSFARAGKYTR